MYRVSDMKAVVEAVLVYNNRLHNECVSTNPRHKYYFYVLPLPYPCHYNLSLRIKFAPKTFTLHLEFLKRFQAFHKFLVIHNHSINDVSVQMSHCAST